MPHTDERPTQPAPEAGDHLAAPPPGAGKRWPLAIAVLCIAIFALLLRLWLIPGRIMVEGDGVHYASLARNVLQGRLVDVLNEYWSNLWIAVIALFAWPLGDVVLAGRLASALSGAALVFPAYLIAHAGMGVRAGILAAILIAIQPWLLHFSSLVYSEPLFNLLLLTALLCAVYAVRRRGWWWWAALGLVTVLAMLTREAAGSVVLLLPVLAWLAYRRFADRRLVTRNLAVFLAVVLLGMGARYAIGRAVFGDWQRAGFGLKGTANLIIGDSFYDTVALETLIRQVDSSGRTKYQALLEDGTAWQYVLSDPPALARRVVVNARHAWDSSLRVLPPIPQTWPWPARLLLILLAGAGLLACWRRSRDVAAIILSAFVLTLAPLLLFFIHDRMVVPLAPLVCLALAFALAWLAERSPLAGKLVYAGIVIAALLSVRWAAAAPTIYAGDPPVQKEAGLWLRATQPQSSRLMAYDPFAPFYFYDDSPYAHYLPLPFIRTPQELVEQARAVHADIIALPEWYVRLGGAGTDPLITPEGTPPPELERLVILGASPTRMFIYRLRVER